MHKLAVVTLLASLGMTLGITLAAVTPEHVPHRAAQRQPIEWLGTPRRLAKFRLETETGEFNNQSLRGQWTIVVFGFLHCPDICPTSLALMASLAKRLANNQANKSSGANINYVFVSVDPDRDSVNEVGQYVRYFDPSIVGVTGDKAQLNRFAQDLGIQFNVSPAHEDYKVAHSVTFSIIDPEGAFRGRFSPDMAMPHLINHLTSTLN